MSATDSDTLTASEWALDRLAAAPTGRFTSLRQRAQKLQKWIAEHASASHRDHARACQLAAEHPDKADAIRAEARHALDRREPERRAAEQAFTQSTRVLEQAGCPLDHGPAWGVTPVVADAIERTAVVHQSRMASVPRLRASRPRGAGRPAGHARRVASADDDDGPPHQASRAHVAPGHEGWGYAPSALSPVPPSQAPRGVDASTVMPPAAGLCRRAQMSCRTDTTTASGPEGVGD